MPTHPSAHSRSPLIVGFGGSARPGSTTDIALLAALKRVERLGANTRYFGGQFLAGLPQYDPAASDRTEAQRQFVDAIRVADGIVVATPAYHGNVSSLVKNALDLLEDLRDDFRPYLQGRGVGCLVTGGGAQAGGVTLMALRGTIHALRGWPTPLGVTLDLSGPQPFSTLGQCEDPRTLAQLDVLARDLIEFAIARRMMLQSEDYDLTESLRQA